MEEYFEEVKSRLKRFKLKGKKAQGYGAERYNSWNSKKTDHTRDYGKRSQKINERIAKRLRRDEKNEGLNNTIVDDEYEEKIEIEELRKKALEESQIPQLEEKEVTRKFNNIENMQQEEKKLLQQIHQIRVEKVKEKLKLIESRENISILFKEWKAFEEVILAKAKNNNLGGIVAWHEYDRRMVDEYGNGLELNEYVIRLQNQVLHIYEYLDNIQIKLEDLTEAKECALKRKIQEDSNPNETIGWRRMLGNQYSLEESFDIDAILSTAQDKTKKLSHFEQVLIDSSNSKKTGKGTKETAKIILEDMQSSRKVRE